MTHHTKIKTFVHSLGNYVNNPDQIDQEVNDFIKNVAVKNITRSVTVFDCITTVWYRESMLD